MGYRIIPLHMDVASNDKQQIVGKGTRITEVILLTMPAGVSFKLALGENEAFTVDKPITLQPDAEDLNNQGLYWINPVARPGVSLELVVVFGAGGANAAGVTP
jgi:hypothetical protein